MQIIVLLIALASSLAQNRGRRPPVQFKKSPGLNLPDNATAIRENIVDTFTCENRIYGYYADMDNECQIFHVCLPQARRTVRFSFICPTETVFNQALFVCTRNESSIPCEESEKFYNLNQAFGEVEQPAITDLPGNELDPSTRPPQRPPAGPPYPSRPPSNVPTTSQRPVYPTAAPPRPTRPTTLAPDFPTIPQRPTRPTTVAPDYPTIPQRPTRPTLPDIQQFPTQRPARPPTFSPQTFTSDYPATFYPQRPGQGNNRPWL